MTWTPPDPLDGVTGYRIDYTGGSSVDIDSGSTNTYTLENLQTGEAYTISIVATSEHFFSEVTTVQVTLSEKEKSIIYILFPVPSPGEVLVSVVSISATSISLSWSVSSGERVDSWEWP